MRYHFIQLEGLPVINFAHSYSTDRYKFDFNQTPSMIEITAIELGAIWRKETGQDNLQVPAGGVNVRLQDFCGSMFAVHQGLHRHSTVGMLVPYSAQPLDFHQALQLCKDSKMQPWPSFALLLKSYFSPQEYSTNVQNALQSIIHISHTDQIAASLQCGGLCLELLASLSRDCVRSIMAQDTDASVPPSAIAYSRRAMDYIAMHYSEALSVSRIAKEMNITPNYLNALFKAAIGKSVMQYVTEIRLRTVRELLAQNKATLAEAGHMVGIEDANYLSRLFHKFYGVTAREMYKDKYEPHFYSGTK